MSEVPVLRIGPFSRASWLSVKALRSYHEMGLLIPAVVDPRPGYRSYTVAQLTDATAEHVVELSPPVPLPASRGVRCHGFGDQEHPRRPSSRGGVVGAA